MKSENLLKKLNSVKAALTAQQSDFERMRQIMSVCKVRNADLNCKIDELISEIKPENNAELFVHKEDPSSWTKTMKFGGYDNSLVSKYGNDCLTVINMNYSRCKMVSVGNPKEVLKPTQEISNTVCFDDLIKFTDPLKGISEPLVQILGRGDRNSIRKGYVDHSGNPIELKNINPNVTHVQVGSNLTFRKEVDGLLYIYIDNEYCYRLFEDQNIKGLSEIKPWDVVLKESAYREVDGYYTGQGQLVVLNLKGLGDATHYDIFERSFWCKSTKVGWLRVEISDKGNPRGQLLYGIFPPREENLRKIVRKVLVKY